MRYARGTCALAVLLLLVSGCASAPKEQFYTLTSATRSDVAALPSQDYAVVVGPVFIPDMVDRPQFVLRMRGSEVRIAEQVRWAEPLKDGIARAVAANVAQSLNNGRVYPRAQSGGQEADYRVIVDVHRFDSVLADAAMLEVMWSVRHIRNGEQETGQMTLREPVAGPGYEELVSAHTRAIAALSRGIAEAIRNSRQKELAAGPPVQRQ